MLAELIRRRGSRQKGRLGTPILSDTVDSYISAIRTMRGVEAHYTVTLASTNVILPAASKRARQAQPPGSRQLRRGIRATHLRKLAASGYDRKSARDLLESAAALVAWNLLLIGGEIGVVTGKPFDHTSVGDTVRQAARTHYASTTPSPRPGKGRRANPHRPRAEHKAS